MNPPYDWVCCFDWHNRFEKLDRTGDPLLKLNIAVNWELFRAELEALRKATETKASQEEGKAPAAGEAPAGDAAPEN